MKAPGISPQREVKKTTGERGFTLIEAAIAMVVLMIVLLGVASLFIYSINYNKGALERAASLAVAQQQMERLRKTPFAQVVTPAQPEPDITMAGRDYAVVTTVDGSATLKRITVQITPKSAGPNWIRNSVTVVTERTQSGIGTYFP